MMEREVSPKRVAANEANCPKSTGPKKVEGRRLKVEGEMMLRRGENQSGQLPEIDGTKKVEGRRLQVESEIILRRGENAANYEQLHQELTKAWQPDDVMQEMLVETIAHQSWVKAQLRSGWLESQLTALQSAQIQAQRGQLLARRWLPGASAVEAAAQGLWQAKDSPSKFKKILYLLDRLEKWFVDEVCPDEYPAAMRALYGECPSLAGQKIRLLFVQFLGSDEVAAEKAMYELPKWIAQERRDVQEERYLYHLEMVVWGNSRPTLSEKQVARREAALKRQIREDTRLLLQLKTKRPQWGPRPETGDADVALAGTCPDAPSRRGLGKIGRPASSPCSGAASGQSAEPIPTNGPATGPNWDETVAAGGEIPEKRKNGSNEANQIM